jgi:large subunit ribosomal protein L9
MIAHELGVLGYDIDRRTIIIDEPIKSLGVFDVKVKLHPEVIATFKVWIISA